MDPWIPYGIAGVIISSIVIPAVRAVWLWWTKTGYPALLRPLQDMAHALADMTRTLIDLRIDMRAAAVQLHSYTTETREDIADIKEDVAAIYAQRNQPQPSRLRRRASAGEVKREVGGGEG